VIEAGEGITDIQTGDRVACAGAGFAIHGELACVPRLLAARIPVSESAARDDRVPWEEAAFATLGAIALHGIRTAEVKLGDRVAVIGLGLLGQLTVQLLKAAGCRVLGTDINGPRAELALQLGADAVAASTADFRDLCCGHTGGLGADAVLITAETPSSDPVNLAGAIARDRAVVVAVGTVGMDIERRTYYEKELDFRISRSYGPGRYDAAYEQKGRDYPIGHVRWTETRNLEAFLQLLAEKKVSVAPLITHRFPIEDAERAYELITGKTGEPFLGVVIQYPEACDEARALELPHKSGSPPKPRTDAAVISVGLLGAGSFAASTLIPAMKASGTASLVGVCAATGAHARHAAQKFGFAHCATEEARVIEDAAINTVVIATRHHLHAGQVLRALDVRKNVFCEKPLCRTEDELREIVRAYLTIDPSERPALMVGFNRRFAPMTAHMKTFVAAIAEPLSLNFRVNAGYLPPDHWLNDPEQGGGRILGEGCHFIDLLMFLAGSPIVEVEARPLRNAGRYSGDNVLMSVSFANGSQGSISYFANGDRSISKERLEVFGGGAAAVLEDFRRLELAREGRKRTVHARWRQDKGHRAEWEAFAQCIRGRRGAAIPFEEVVCSMLATLRVQQAIANGRRVSVDAAAFIESALA